MILKADENPYITKVDKIYAVNINTSVYEIPNTIMTIKSSNCIDIFFFNSTGSYKEKPKGDYASEA